MEYTVCFVFVEVRQSFRRKNESRQPGSRLSPLVDMTLYTPMDLALSVKY